jgi:hypothetical protein
VNPKAFGGFQNGQSFALAEGNGLCLLLGRESAALSGHGVHSRLGRRLSDLSIEPGQPQYVDQQQFDQALEVADRSKARNLVELLSTKDLYPKGEIPVDVIRRLDELRGSIARAERELNRGEQLSGREFRPEAGSSRNKSSGSLHSARPSSTTLRTP